MRSKLIDQAGYQDVKPVAVAHGTPLKDAAEKYFANSEACNADPKTLRTYRSAVDPFVANCKKPCVEHVTKQDLLDFMPWLKKQPLPKRRYSNPKRTC